MNTADIVKAAFNEAIESSVAFAKREAVDEGVALARRRKLPPEKVVEMICLMGGNSLQKELKDYPNIDVCASSFVEARAKIDPMVFYNALMHFNAHNEDSGFLFENRRLVGIDATCINCAYAQSNASFVPMAGSAKGGVNLLRATSFVDLLSRLPVDLSVTTMRQGEFSTALGMLAFNPPSIPTIYVADRLYSSYSFISELQNMNNTDFVIRTKSGAGALKPIQRLPTDSEYDEDLQFVLTDSQSKASKAAGHIYVPSGSKRGKASSPNTYISKFSQPLPYVMKLRAVCVKLPNDSYEVLLTSLKRSEFSAERIAEIYRLRWNIELFYRHIKYDCALSRMHSIKDDHSLQQIYGTFLTSSAIWKIVNSVALQQSSSHKYVYALNIKMASYLIRTFLREPEADSERLFRELRRYVVPIRPNREEERRMSVKSFVPLVYRVT